MISIIIPVYNEEEAIEETIRTVHDVFSGLKEEHEIIAIDDGSTDRTPDILAALDFPTLRVITQPRNRGYGAALKLGIRRSQGDVIAMTDADGTYPIEEFPHLLQTFRKEDTDMVIGARTKKGAKIPLIRRPAKMIVNALANALVGMRIPDINSGMRVFTRELGERFMHLYPQRFSFTITLTLAALTNDYIVEFVPIEYFKRKGKSSLALGMSGLRNFVGFLGLIVRITTYFRPLKFFMWPAALLGITGIVTIGYTLWEETNVSDAGLLLLLTGLQIGLFGLLAEVIVRSRTPS